MIVSKLAASSPDCVNCEGASPDLHAENIATAAPAQKRIVFRFCISKNVCCLV
jgi:hypothetical protein